MLVTKKSVIFRVLNASPEPLGIMEIVERTAFSRNTVKTNLVRFVRDGLVVHETHGLYAVKYSASGDGPDSLGLV